MRNSSFSCINVQVLWGAVCEVHFSVVDSNYWSDGVLMCFGSSYQYSSLPYPTLPQPPYFTDSISMTSARLLPLLLCIGARGFIARICHPWEWFPSRSCWLPLFQWKAQGIWVKVKNPIPPMRRPQVSGRVGQHTTDTLLTRVPTLPTYRPTHHRCVGQHTTNTSADTLPMPFLK